VTKPTDSCVPLGRIRLIVLESEGWMLRLLFEETIEEPTYRHFIGSLRRTKIPESPP